MSNYRKLIIKWSVSRGRETQGYNICSLWENNKKRFSCNGGGYDMTGTVFANWLEEEYQNKLCTIFERANTIYPEQIVSVKRENLLYGMTAHLSPATKMKVTLDGACGLSSMMRIAEALGLEVEQADAGKNIDVFFVSEVTQ